MPAGRPTIYSDEIAETICDLIASGESLVSICKSSDDLPGIRTVLRWAKENADFGMKYAGAREAQAEVMDDKILTAADEAEIDPQAARVRIEAYKWRAAKLAPKSYGDNSRHLLGSDPDNPLPTGFNVNLVKSAARTD